MSQYSWWLRVLWIPYSSTVIVPVSRYLPSAWRLTQSVYYRTFSASVRHMCKFLDSVKNSLFRQFYPQIGEFG